MSTSEAMADASASASLASSQVTDSPTEVRQSSCAS